MENTTAEESKEVQTTSPGIETQETVKKTAPETVNDQKGKTAAVKEEPVKETISVNEKATKKQTAKKKAAAKKTAKKKINKDIKSFFDENSNPEVMLIVEENPNEMIFNAIVESESELPVSKKKNKKGKKSDKKKAAKKHTLCKLVKNDFLKKHFSEYRDLVANPEWICKKCGRVANDPKSLCKPILLSKNDSGDIIIS